MIEAISVLAWLTSLAYISLASVTLWRGRGGVGYMAVVIIGCLASAAALFGFGLSYLLGSEASTSFALAYLVAQFVAIWVLVSVVTYKGIKVQRRRDGSAR